MTTWQDIGAGRPAWRVHRWGQNPELDEIVARRFGSRFDRPCNNPNIVECAMWECQQANRCARYPSPPSKEGE